MEINKQDLLEIFCDFKKLYKTYNIVLDQVLNGDIDGVLYARDTIQLDNGKIVDSAYDSLVYLAKLLGEERLDF